MAGWYGGADLSLKKPQISSTRHIVGGMNPASDAPAGVAFGRFRVLPHRRELLADGQPIKLVCTDTARGEFLALLTSHGCGTYRLLIHSASII